MGKASENLWASRQRKGKYVVWKGSSNEDEGRRRDRFRETYQRDSTSRNGSECNSNPLSSLLRTLGNRNKIFLNTCLKVIRGLAGK